jgi:hypothetical protein
VGVVDFWVRQPVRSRTLVAGNGQLIICAQSAQNPSTSVIAILHQRLSRNDATLRLSLTCPFYARRISL